MVSFTPVLHGITKAYTFISEITFSPDVFGKKERILSAEERTALDTKISQFAKELGVRKKLMIVEGSNLGYTAKAFGANALPGRAGLSIDVDLFRKLNSGEQEFVLRHEIVHIKNSDTISITLLVASVAFLVLFSLAVYAAHIGNTLIITEIALMIFLSRRHERLADKEAFLHCSVSGKQGGISSLEKNRKRALAVRDDQKLPLLIKLIAHLAISSEGNFRLDVFHPSLPDRISYLRTWLSE